MAFYDILYWKWHQIEPREGYFDDAAIEHYRDEIKGLIGSGITPFVTLHHFSHPTWFEEMGAFEVADNNVFFVRFCQYVRKVVEIWKEKSDEKVTLFGSILTLLMHFWHFLYTFLFIFMFNFVYFSSLFLHFFPLFLHFSPFFFSFSSFSPLFHPSHPPSPHRRAFQEYSPLVTHWCTINEVEVYVSMAYFLGTFPPGRRDAQMTAVVLRNMLEAHVQVYLALKGTREDGYSVEWWV